MGDKAHKVETSDFLREGERLDDLQRDGLKLIQNPDWFCFGMDAVLLTAFADVRDGDRCIDLCTGNGVIPILLSGRTKGESFRRSGADGGCRGDGG